MHNLLQKSQTKDWDISSQRCQNMEKHALATKATINIGLMEYEEGSDVLKLVRGSSLPLKIKTSASYQEALDAA